LVGERRSYSSTLSYGDDIGLISFITEPGTRSSVRFLKEIRLAL